MEQLIIDNAPAIIAVIGTGLGWLLARLKDAIDVKVKATKNGWDDAMWVIIKSNLPK